MIFWHYDITNEGTTNYDDNIVFGLYMDSGVGGPLLSCDGIYESDDDNAAFDKQIDIAIQNIASHQLSAKEAMQQAQQNSLNELKRAGVKL